MKKTNWIIAVAAVILIAAAAIFCARQNRTIKDNEEVISNLESQLTSSQDSESELKNLTMQQNEELSDIMSELAAIAGRTTDLKEDLENGTAALSQANSIKQSISDIRAKIASLERANSSNIRQSKEFQRVIDNFKVVVEKQEAEINSLKAEIEAKDKTIKTQQSTIDTQVQTISKQKEELEALVKKQARSLFDAGADLEEIGDASPKVSWSNNRKKVAAMQQTIYQEALKYYQMAFEAGYTPAAEAIDSVKVKITVAE